MADEPALASPGEASQLITKSKPLKKSPRNPTDIRGRRSIEDAKGVSGETTNQATQSTKDQKVANSKAGGIRHDMG